MKCGMLIAVPIHAWAPAPTSTRSERPLKRSGTKTISDNPPTSRRWIAGLKIDPALTRAAGVYEAPADVAAEAADCGGGEGLVMYYRVTRRRRISGWRGSLQT